MTLKWTTWNGFYYIEIVINCNNRSIKIDYLILNFVLENL